MKTYKIYTLGCKVNQYDSGKLGRDLETLGISKATENADLAIVNTCTVTHSALTRDEKMLEQARRENPGAKFAIVGCMPANYRKEAEGLCVDYIYKSSELGEFVKQVKKDLLIEDVECAVIPLNNKNNKSRYFLKVQDGCRQFCSYCIIAHNRGPLQSRAREEVIREVELVTQQGVAEVVLCGIHLGLYGVDLHITHNTQHITLATLLKELFKIENLRKARLSSIEITEVNDELIELMRVNRKFARHLHISLQNGNDKILQSMNRPYTKGYFRQRVAKIREAAPEVAISTDVIVGFPGETEADFLETMQFCEEIGFSKIHVFPFSAHEKTPAFNFPDQLSETIKKQRAKSLQKLSDELERRYNESFVGQEIEVIIDGRSKGKNYRGKSEYYFDVVFESDEKLEIGQLVKIKNWKLI